MNVVEIFQGWVAQVPELVQPLIVALAGAVPFVEGEGAAAIGIVGGINPIVAAVAAAAGNFLCVAILVLISAGTRDAIVARRRSRVVEKEFVLVGGEGGGTAVPVADAEIEESARKAARRQKFQRALERYGVPGVSLLGPLLLPTQFTSTMLAAIGVSKARVLVWQAIAIAGWTTLITLVLTGVVHAFA